MMEGVINTLTMQKKVLDTEGCIVPLDEPLVPKINTKNLGDENNNESLLKVINDLSPREMNELKQVCHETSFEKPPIENLDGSIKSKDLQIENSDDAKGHTKENGDQIKNGEISSLHHCASGSDNGTHDGNGVTKDLNDLFLELNIDLNSVGTPDDIKNTNDKTKAVKKNKKKKNKDKRRERERQKSESNNDSSKEWKCRDPGCLKENPGNAKFCGSCGLSRVSTNTGGEFRQSANKPGQEKRAFSINNWTESNCWASYVDNPLVIYFHTGSKRDDFIKVDIKLNDMMNRSTNKRPSTIEVDEMYAGFYEGKWWRITIKDVQLNGQYRAHLVDHGRNINIPKQYIFMLDNNFLRLSPMTDRYILNNLYPLYDRSNQRRVQTFVEEMLLNKKVTLEVLALDCKKTGQKTLFANVFVDNCFLNYELYMLRYVDLKLKSKRRELIEKNIQFKEAKGCKDYDSSNMPAFLGRPNSTDGLDGSYHPYGPVYAPERFADIPRPASPRMALDQRGAVGGILTPPLQDENHYEHVLNYYQGKLRAYEESFEKIKECDNDDIKLHNICEKIAMTIQLRLSYGDASENSLFEKCNQMLTDIPGIHIFLNSKLDIADQLKNCVRDHNEISSRMFNDFVSDGDIMKMNSIKISFEAFLHDINSDDIMDANYKSINDSKFKEYCDWMKKYKASKDNLNSATSKLAQVYQDNSLAIKNLMANGEHPYLCNAQPIMMTVLEACREEFELAKVFTQDKVVDMMKTQAKNILNKIIHIQASASYLKSYIKADLSDHDLVMNNRQSLFENRTNVHNSISILDFLVKSPNYPKDSKMLLVKDLIAEIKLYHQRGESYLYINPQNVQINDDGCVKLVDKSVALIHEPIPPWKFAAPELAVETCQKDCLAADIYSLGQVIVWLFCLGEDNQIDMMVNKDKYFPMLTNIISTDPSKRPKIEDLNIAHLNELLIPNLYCDSDLYDIESNIEKIGLIDLSSDSEGIVANEEDAIMKEIEVTSMHNIQEVDLLSAHSEVEQNKDDHELVINSNVESVVDLANSSDIE